MSKIGGEIGFFFSEYVFHSVLSSSLSQDRVKEICFPSPD